MVKTQGESYPKTWSNPSGAVLLRLQPDLWVAERPFVWNNIDVGGKMAVIRLIDDSLWVHSPVNLDEPLRPAMTRRDQNKIKEVKRVITVSPTSPTQSWPLVFISLPWFAFAFGVLSVRNLTTYIFRVHRSTQHWRQGELWRIWALWST